MTVCQISVQEAFLLLKQNQKSILIDVRTAEEFRFVGVVNAADFGDRMALIPWQFLPQMQENPDFAAVLENALSKNFGSNDKEINLLFICRSGARSNAAANYAAAIGYKNCYNLTSGFEGELNQQQQRGKINGWKASNLPWRQN